MHQRLNKLLVNIQKMNLDALLVTTPANTYYLSGFRAIAYTRPVVMLVTEEAALVVPELEEEHAKENTWLKKVFTYSDKELGGEYNKTPMDLAIEKISLYIKDFFRGKPVKIGFEAHNLSYDVYEKLTSLPGELKACKGIVEEIRKVKDSGEIDFIRKGCAIGDYGMEYEKNLTKEGISEIEIMVKGNAAMMIKAVKDYPHLTIDAGSRPICGEKTVIPHSIPAGNKVKPGDVVLHGAGALVEGYYSENERIFLVSPVTDEKKKAFMAATEAQIKAIEAIKPGIKCSHIHKAANDCIIKKGYSDYLLHRTGHSIGLDIHEGPFFSENDTTILKRGMVLTVEPGIYIPGVGGFRHSDTVLVTDDGCEVLTKFSKKFEDAVI